MRVINISDTVQVVIKDNSVKIEIECDDKTGAGFALEKISQVLPYAVPTTWLHLVQEQGEA